MNYEVGKYYRTRGDERALCVHRSVDGQAVFVVEPLGQDLHIIATTRHGRAWTDTTDHTEDIIGPWIDKPDIPWHLLPKCAVACAIDQGGTWHWFSAKPSPEGAWWTFHPETKSGLLYPEHCPTWTGDWKDSLVERPKV